MDFTKTFLVIPNRNSKTFNDNKNRYYELGKDIKIIRITDHCKIMMEVFGWTTKEVMDMWREQRNRKLQGLPPVDKGEEDFLLEERPVVEEYTVEQFRGYGSLENFIKTNPTIKENAR